MSGLLAGKKIILGVTGSIAAYKAALLTRLMVKKGAEVRVIMTPAAKQFISPLTLATLSKNPVWVDLMDEHTWHNHVELSLWADLMVVAPASANTLAKLATGQCDNLLLATYLAARAPVWVAPAMDVDMYHHPATQKNLQTLKDIGLRVLPVGHGELASGLEGDGRMAEPEELVSYLEQHFRTSKTLAGVNALVTAGPTYEPLDPVRFIGNHSSGKMGVAIAQELVQRGALVTLLLGPTKTTLNLDGINVIRVETAEEMGAAAVKHYPHCQLAMLAAAVADYKPKERQAQKIKKTAGTLVIELERTIDIAATLGQLKQPGQINIGFALETEDEEMHARQKMTRKNFDMIVLNTLNDPGAGFNHDTNAITILSPDNKKEKFELKSKQAVARDIVDRVVPLLTK